MKATKLVIKGFGSHTHKLAGFVATTRYEDMNTELVTATKRMLLDTLGCIIAARGTDIGPIVNNLSQAFSNGNDRNVLSTAYGMGRLGNALDLDEGIPSGTHFGCGAVGAALALSVNRRVSGRDLLTALNVGYEVGGRVGDAIGPYFKTKDGAAKSFASVWGAMTPVVFAAAGTAAKLLGHDEQLVAQTFGSAGANTPVPIGAKWSAEVDPPNTKYGDTGWCTVTGVFGALAAEAGSTGIDTFLDEPNSLYAMVSAQNPHPEIVSTDLGTRWRVHQILYKKWPCCRWVHYPLTALVELMRIHDFSAADVDHVTVRVGFAATSHRFVTQRPASFAAYQFSIPHAVTMVLLNVPPGPGWVSSGIAQHPMVQALRDKIFVETHDREWEFADFRFAPVGSVRRLPAAIEVNVGPEIYRGESEFALGDSYCADMCWGDAEVIDKFRTLVEAPVADKIIETIYRLEDLEDVDLLHKLLDSAVSIRPDKTLLDHLSSQSR